MITTFTNLNGKKTILAQPYEFGTPIWFMAGTVHSIVIDGIEFLGTAQVFAEIGSITINKESYVAKQS
jgi:hypothetical protein